MTNSPGRCKIHCGQMAKILDLDVRAVVDYHSHPGVMSRTWKSKAEFHDDFYKVLTKTGEQDGWWMHHFVVEYSCFL